MHSYIHTFNLYIYFFDFIEAAAMFMLQSRVIYNPVSFLLLQKKGGRFTDLHTVFFVFGSQTPCYVHVDFFNAD